MRDLSAAFLVFLLSFTVISGQTPAPEDHTAHTTPTPQAAGLPSPWMVMYDGVLFGTFSRQSGPRGGRELISTNWFMGMASRQAGPGRLTLTGMVSLERATTGPRGYIELFQVGETYRYIPIVNRQHPHDLLMQASAAWRIQLDEKTAITFAGAPVGEAALGPGAFMHRRSAAENSAAPLSHHTLDSTHIAMGVISVAVDHAPWVFETSVFQSGEPDDNRWDLVDFGALDSWSARVWYKPSDTWELQASHAFLENPERLEFAHIRRTTASAAWLKTGASGFTAATFAFGRNDKEFHGTFHAALAEATRQQGRLAVYGRLESLQVETPILLTQGTFHSHSRMESDIVTAATVGGVLEMPQWRRFELGLGADVTSYVVPEPLKVTHSDRPLSFRVFLRVRPPASAMGRMWNMRMGGPPHH